jgi:rRNA maturation endonuclease Nob1
MSKSGGWIYQRRFQGACIGCGTRFVGPGDRCQPCQQKLKARKRRKPR